MSTDVNNLSDEEFDKQFEAMLSEPVEEEPEVVEEEIPVEQPSEPEEEPEAESEEDNETVEQDEDTPEESADEPDEEVSSEDEESDTDTSTEKEPEEVRPFTFGDLPMDEVLPFDVKASGSKKDIEKLIKEAQEYKFRSVCIHPS